MKTTGLSENRALLQVLTHAENTSRSPLDILKGAVAGGVVVSFTDEKNRYADAVLMPSPSDLATLAILITEGCFVPSLHRVAGDQLPQYTALGESGCFESLAIPVLLFPDCFAVPSACETTPHSSPSRPQQSTAAGLLSTSLDLHPSQSGVSAISADIYQLHKLRSNVGILLLKSINEVLQDAELRKLKASRSKNEKGNAPATELATTNAVIALFYEVKILLLCCILSSDIVYREDDVNTNAFTSASSCFSEILPQKELFKIFEHESRSSAGDVEKWYDVVLKTIRRGALTWTNSELQTIVGKLKEETVADGVRVSVLPLQLLHRPHDTTSTTLFQLSFPRIELPRLETQPGEMHFLFTDSCEQPLLFDANPSRLFFLLRHCANMKLTLVQMGEVDNILANAPWQSLCSSLVETLRHYLSADQYVCTLLEKNSSFLVKLIQWLQEDAPVIDNEEYNKDEVVDERERKEKSVAERKRMGVLTATNIMEYAIHVAPFNAGVAQFMREMVEGGLLGIEEFNAWVRHVVTELENKFSTTVGLFALVIIFALAHRGWELEEDTREEAIRFFTQHRHQQNCLQLLNLLRR